jgi:galactonate dehydratase
MARHTNSIRTIKLARLAALAALPAPASKPQVAIRDVKAHAVREPAGGRTYLVVMLETDAGVTGVGETHARPDPGTAVARVLEQKENLVGQDALAAETVHHMLAVRNSGRGDLAPVQAAVNMALLDILGKLSRAPVYQVVGGPTRQKARAFAHLHGTDEASLKTSLQRARAAGYKAFQVPLAIPEGPVRGRSYYRETRELLERLRAAGGEDTDFILDCGGRLSTAEAAGLGAELERFHLLWLEEPLATINERAAAKLSGESVTPVGFGRNVEGNNGFQDLLRMDAIDILRPDVARAGITQIRKAAAMAETYYVAFAPFHRGGPLGTAAALHAAVSTANFFIQEVPFPADDRDVEMRRQLAGASIETVKDGFLALPEGNGLGVRLNEDVLKRYEVTV